MQKTKFEEALVRIKLLEKENENLRKQVEKLQYDLSLEDRKKELYWIQNKPQNDTSDRLDTILNDSRKAMENFTSKLKEETKSYAKSK